MNPSKLYVCLILHDHDQFLVQNDAKGKFWNPPAWLHKDHDKAYITNVIKETKKDLGFDIIPYLWKTDDIGEFDLALGKRIRLFSLPMDKLPNIDEYKYILFCEFVNHLHPSMHQIFADGIRIIRQKQI